MHITKTYFLGTIFHTLFDILVLEFPLTALQLITVGRKTFLIQFTYPSLKIFFNFYLPLLELCLQFLSMLLYLQFILNSFIKLKCKEKRIVLCTSTAAVLWHNSESSNSFRFRNSASSSSLSCRISCSFLTPAQITMLRKMNRTLLFYSGSLMTQL